ncbi:MAG: hypothetical protein LC624_06010 [Halobacteriales archaeon]|nr:hypothetical protein [Halobacteriales archaeon]
MRAASARIALAALLLLLPPALAVTPPIPVFVAGKCALVDLQVGEDQIVGAQCTDVRIDSAGHDCLLFDWGMQCWLHWRAHAQAYRWVTDGGATVTLSGSCEDTQGRSWLPGLAVAGLDIQLTCTTDEHFVTRGTCILVPITIQARFSGTLPGPDQALHYESGVCDNRDPV